MTASISRSSPTPTECISGRTICRSTAARRDRRSRARSSESRPTTSSMARAAEAGGADYIGFGPMYPGGLEEQRGRQGPRQSARGPRGSEDSDRRDRRDHRGPHAGSSRRGRRRRRNHHRCRESSGHPGEGPRIACGSRTEALSRFAQAAFAAAALAMRACSVSRSRHASVTAAPTTHSTAKISKASA